MAPGSGIYYIRCLKTRAFLTAKDIASNERITTSSSADPATFFVSMSGGQYEIYERSTGFYVGAKMVGSPRDLQWQRAVYKWVIRDVAPGIYNVGNPTDNAYWFDNAKIGPWMTLSTGSSGDENNFEFVAASV
ncbi:hypothetical protein BDP27DRAFT_1447620 [Rhodocollybia butyracea]|uniref:Uncharacterized protein n=1 Tax=Rhodocollybia butyracea TaxID=206335 RepID=A0A9P5U756_9AGAR|nr:hypothetical protein BDP27DRAFT_1447613 [Rhodocollybia butyracea]KAF9069584.1 hypothetical protein BDP27DRAFT_1447620 [Rhodocollybia butyracea]